ncbi:uncharacterized protein [Euphorbia lathyris]|uniref:uncharacterized protein n=1 Tax=Euphorbia lathyris TaxID=212925 RepID=UPI003313D0E6
MDTRDNRRVISYSGDAPDKTIINQIMLRFRPIAPKPAVAGLDSDLASLNNKDLLLSKRRPKRKYVRVRRNNRLRKNQRVSSSSDQQIGKERESGGLFTERAVTLQLLPDNSDRLRSSPERERSRCNQEFCHQGGNLKLKQPEAVDGVDQTTAATVSKNKLESWVTVECVTETYACMDIGNGRGIGLTDVERVKNLEEEERPGFISDGSDNVRWVNGAYKRMMMKKMVIMREENEKAESVEIIVCLVSKQKLVPFVYCSAFTCWVRLGEKEKSASKMVPCDVWRMDCGGFAWRLDIEAALSLSLGH